MQISREDAFIARMIADRVRRRGESLAQISRSTGISVSRLRLLARTAKIRYRNQRARPEQIKAAMKAVTEQGLTFRAAAQQHGISKTAVHRFVQRRRERLIDSAGDLKVHKVDAWRCPVHGLITVVPCVACAAARD